MTGLATMTCPTHGHPMVDGAEGLVRCPEPGCEVHRQTQCRAFLHRTRGGRNTTCPRPVEVETWAVLPGGREIYHGGRCARHPDRSRYSGPVEFRGVRTP